MKHLLVYIISIFSLSIIFAQDDCSQCEWTFDDPYWGEQCCDLAWNQWGFNCEYMEAEYGWDCTGCNCLYDELSLCGDQYCTGDENYNNCPSDCTLNGCSVANQVDDCSGDGDCVPESWIGDGYCDSEDQPFGVDLTCYGNDGGDCPTPTGDINNDGFVDILDIIIIVDIILEYQDSIDIDLNDDDILNIQDIIIIIYIILG